ncbi:hypothetical protein [Burkholderia ubonensis]|nr:hypothetical protein [Burkholderia ubonensis]
MLEWFEKLSPDMEFIVWLYTFPIVWFGGRMIGIALYNFINGK